MLTLTLFTRPPHALRRLLPTAFCLTLALVATSCGGGSGDPGGGGNPSGAPVASFTASPDTLTQALTVQFDASASSGDIVRYDWDYDSDGVYDAAGTSPTRAYVYPDNGDYTVTLRVTDTQDRTDTATVEISAFPEDNEQPPVAALTADPLTLDDSMTVDFDASASTDPDGSIVSYDWDWNSDGIYDESGADSTVSFTFVTNTSYAVKLRITDDDGLTDFASVTIAAKPVTGNHPPVAFLQARRNGNPITVLPDDLLVDFIAIDSSDSDGTIVRYEWDWQNDGLVDEVGTDPSVSFTYPFNATWTARVRVVDDQGATTDHTVTINAHPIDKDPAPVAALTADPLTLDASRSVDFDASGSTDTGGDTPGVVRYDWDFNTDGLLDLSGSNPAVSFTYPVNGAYTATVRVFDSAGSSDTATVSIAAMVVPGNDPPVAVLTADPLTLDLSLTVDFDASGSTDDVAIAEYRWDFNTDGLIDDTTAAALVSYQYPANDGYQATVYVVDSQGAIDSAWVSISPATLPPNQPPTADLAASPLTLGPSRRIDFDAGGSTDPDGTITAYQWDFNSDGLYDAATAGPQTFFIYPADAAYTATVRVVDNDGATDTALIAIAAPPAPNQMPTAALAADPTTLDATLSVDWDASASDDLDGTVVNYEWDWESDGTYDFDSGADATTTHVYAENANFTATVRVTDDDGATAVASASVSASLTGRLKWSYKANGDLWGSPAIGPDGHLYFGSYDGSIYSVTTGGAFRWSTPVGDYVRTQPAFDPAGDLYFGSYNSAFYRADHITGALEWTPAFDTGGFIIGSPTVSPAGKVLFGSTDGVFYALNPDGSELFSTPLGQPIWSTPAVGGTAIYVGCQDGNLYAIKGDGSIKWQYTMGGQVNGSPTVGPDGVIYVGSDDRKMYALIDAGTHATEKWVFTTSDWIRTRPTIFGSRIYFTGIDTDLYALNKDTGALIWNTSITGEIWSSPAVGADGTVYFGSDGQSFYAVRPNGSVKWEYPTGGWIRSSPVIGPDGTVYVGSRDTYLYAFNP